MDNSKGHGKCWKMMILWNFYNSAEAAGALEQQTKSCWTDDCEIFVSMCKYTSGFIFLTTVWQAAATVTTDPGIHS